MTRIKHQNEKPQGKLAPAFAARDEILLWFHRKNEQPKLPGTGELIAMHKFGAAYAAKKFLEYIIEGEDGPQFDMRWLGPNKLLIDNGVGIEVTSKDSSVALEDIMEHKYTLEEQRWQLPIPYTGYARAVRVYHRSLGADINTHARASQGLKPLTDDECIELDTEDAPELKRRKAEAARATSKPTHEERDPPARTKRSPATPRVSKEGLTTLGELCAQLKLDPKQTRTALRAAGIEKPDAGWTWAKGKQPDLKKIVDAYTKARGK